MIINVLRSYWGILNSLSVYFSTYYTQAFFIYRNSTPFTVCSQVLK